MGIPFCTFVGIVGVNELPLVPFGVIYPFFVPWKDGSTWGSSFFSQSKSIGVSGYFPLCSDRCGCVIAFARRGARRVPRVAFCLKLAVPLIPLAFGLAFQSVAFYPPHSPGIFFPFWRRIVLLTTPCDLSRALRSASLFV